MARIKIDDYLGYPIELNVDRGTFSTAIDGEYYSTESLRGLRERLDSIETAKRGKQRASFDSVVVHCLVWDRPNDDNIHTVFVLPYEWQLKTFKVYGIVAGRISPTIRTVTDDGRKVQHAYPNLFCIHPDDYRYADITEALACYRNAKALLAECDQQLKRIHDQLTRIEVPVARSKETALDKEPAFLEALRNVRPVKQPASSDTLPLDAGNDPITV